LGASGTKKKKGRASSRTKNGIGGTQNPLRRGNHGIEENAFGQNGGVGGGRGEQKKRKQSRKMAHSPQKQNRNKNRWPAPPNPEKWGEGGSR